MRTPALLLLVLLLAFVSIIPQSSGHGEWGILTEQNFSSQPHVLLFVTAPWCGESRSLKNEITQLVQSGKEFESLKLMLVYKNSEKVLAQAIGAANGITILYYHHSVPYNYQGKLRASNILSSVHPYLTSPPEELPLKHLKTPKSLKDFLDSSDKAVLLFEFCGWTTTLLSDLKKNGTEDNLWHEMARKYNGRKKIEVVKIKNEARLQVTFSKRISGLFKKVSELCILCDTKVAIVAFSPSGKLFSFGHPNVDVLIDRFSRRSQNFVLRHSHNTEVESDTNSDLQNLNKVLDEVLAEKGNAKETNKRYQIIKNERLNNNNFENWYQKPPEELNLTQAVHMRHVAEDLKRKVDHLRSHYQQRVIPHQNYYVPSSSNVTPCTTVHSGDNYSSRGLFDQHRRLGTNTFSDDLNMTNTSYQSLPFGYNHDDNKNICERIAIPDSVVNGTPWYKRSQIQNPEFEQGRHQSRPRYY